MISEAYTIHCLEMKTNMEGGRVNEDDNHHFSQETLLHKSIKYSRPDLLHQWCMGGPATDVNTGNRWNQTPLHYAALKRNTDVLEMLLQVPGVDVTILDMNGYNVLHSLIYNTLAFDDWERSIQILLRVGLDVNQATKHGYTILHLACRYTNPSCVLRYILESVSGLNITLINNHGENFLHCLIRSMNDRTPVSDELKDRFKLLEDLIKGKLSCCQSEHLLQLFKQQDTNGITPFLLMLSRFDKYRNFNAIKLLKSMSSFGECSSIPDNLGNYPIHYAIACLQKTPSKLLEMLISAGIDINSRNMFEQTTAHLVRVNKKDLTSERTKSIRNIMKTNRLHFDRRDKWGCTPWMYISAFYNDSSLPYLHDISPVSSNLDSTDMNGSTALHHAAYHDSPIYIGILLNHGANPYVKDTLGDTPLDTARKHLNLSSENALLKYTNTEKLYDQNQEFMENLYSLKKSSKVRMDMDEFAEELLDRKYRCKSDDDENINRCVRYFVELICHQIEKYDSRFAMSIFQSGSSAEKTKVNAPDEFDFVLCLDKISEFCIVEERTQSRGNRMKVKEFEGHADFLEFFDDTGTFITPTVFMYFHRYLKRALHEPNLWKDENLKNVCYIFETPFLEKDMITTVFMTRLLWIGPWHKQLRIKIDMLPAVKKSAWWPIDPYSVPLMTKEIQDAGCLLMLDTRSEYESFTDDYFKEFISDSIDRIDPKSTDLRISTAPAEVCLMKTFPQKVRDSYALAKLFVELWGTDEITSYMLKNCTFYVMYDLHWNPNKPEDFETTLSVRELTILILQKLLKFNRESCLPRFFLPEVNVFPSDDDIQDRKRQKKDIKFVLKILGLDISLDSDESDDDVYFDDDSDENSDDSN